MTGLGLLMNSEWQKGSGRGGKRQFGQSRTIWFCSGLHHFLGCPDLEKPNSRNKVECVVNLPTPDMWQQVEKLAPLTGKNPVPELKAKQFHFEPEKFETANLTPLASDAAARLRLAAR